MKIRRTRDQVFTPARMAGAEGVSVTKLIAAGEASPTVAMRLFEIAPGGKTPWHAHGWEHVIYGVEGQGALVTEAGSEPFGPGDALLVEPDEMHNFANTGSGRLRFVCVVPLHGDA